MTPFEDKEELKKLECNSQHVFHEMCIIKWFEKKPECPLCRFNYADTERNMIIERAHMIDSQEGEIPGEHQSEE